MCCSCTETRPPPTTPKVTQLTGPPRSIMVSWPEGGYGRVGLCHTPVADSEGGPLRRKCPLRRYVSPKARCRSRAGVRSPVQLAPYCVALPDRFVFPVIVLQPRRPSHRAIPCRKRSRQTRDEGRLSRHTVRPMQAGTSPVARMIFCSVVMSVLRPPTGSSLRKPTPTVRLNQSYYKGAPFPSSSQSLKDTRWSLAGYV